MRKYINLQFMTVLRAGSNKFEKGGGGEKLPTKSNVLIKINDLSSSSSSYFFHQLERPF